MNPLFRTYFAIILVSMILLLGSCGTGRNAVSRGNSPRDNSGRTENIANAASPTVQLERISGLASEIVKEARTWIGTPYIYGGHSRKGTDCSGMVMEVFKKVTNIKLPRSAQEQQQYCSETSRERLNPGDLIFFSPSKNSRVSHVGIYIGNNRMIHASSSRGVIESNIYENWFVQHYHSSGFILRPSSEPTIQPNSEIQAIDLERMLDMKTDSILSIYMD